MMRTCRGDFRGAIFTGDPATQGWQGTHRHSSRMAIFRPFARVLACILPIRSSLVQLGILGALRDYLCSVKLFFHLNFACHKRRGFL